MALCPPQENPRLTEDFVTHLETELEQSRLREAETLGALRELQDKVLDMEKVGRLRPSHPPFLPGGHCQTLEAQGHTNTH